MEGKVKILETYSKSEEMISYFLRICRIYTDYVEQKCHILVTTLSCLATHEMEGKPKYWKQIRNLKKLQTFILYFVHLETFIAMSLSGNIHVWLGCTKTRSPGIGTVLQ